MVTGDFAVSVIFASVSYPMVLTVLLYELEGEESEAESGLGNRIKDEPDPCENFFMVSLRFEKDGRWAGSSCQHSSMMSYL